MSLTSDRPQEHNHFFLGDRHNHNERKVWMVIVLTTIMMVIEIIGGHIYGSMALVADGWHMSTHAGAMLITALAYRYARHHIDDPRFTFSTGKVGDLAGFASAMILALISLLIGWDSIVRLLNPTPINFVNAIEVASVGLVVNLVCAWLLKDDHHHGHGHSHGHDHSHHHGHHHDNNFKAAYVHILADALTSIFAIAALLLGKRYGWVWADPLMGVVGALVIINWSWSLIKDSGSILLDAAPKGIVIQQEIQEAISPFCNYINDLHVWQVGPGHFSAIVVVTTDNLYTPSFYKEKLRHIHEISHISIEIQALDKAA